MKKKLFSIIMCILMVMCFMPTATFADVQAGGDSTAEDSSSVTLPEGITEDSFTDGSTVYYAGKYYTADSSKGALELAIDAANTANSNKVAKIYIKPNATNNNKELVKQAHQGIKTSIAIYGNGASLDYSWEPCVENSGNAYHVLTKNISIEMYDLNDGAGVWGMRTSTYTVDVTMKNCKNVHELMLNGQNNGGKNNITNYTIENSTFDSTKYASTCPVTTTNAGDVILKNCTFTNINENYPVGINNKNGGTTKVTIENCTFINCGSEGKQTVRLVGEAEGSSVVATLSNLTFRGSEENSESNGYDIVIGKSSEDENKANVSYTISGTKATLTTYIKGKTTAVTMGLVDADGEYTGYNETLNITGGTFNTDPTAYVKTGTCIKSTTTGSKTTWAVGHDYTWVTDAAKAATCTEAGKTEGKHCSVCGTVLVAQQEIPAHHDLTKTEAKAATYSATGNKEYYTCSACGKKFWDSEGTAEITEEKSWVILQLTRSSSSSSTTKTDNVTNTTETTKTESGTTEAKAETKATVSAETKTAADGTKTTTATVDTTTATKIVEKAVENKSEEVVVTAAATPVAETAAGTTTEVAIPAETVSQIAEKTTAAVTIESEAAKVTLDQEAVAAVAEQAGEAGTVSLVVETKAQDENKVEVELKLETSNGAVSDFKGGTVSVTVKLNSALAAKPVMCVYIDDNGVYHKVAGQKNADGTYTFQTGHFSTYAIMPEDEANDVIAQQNEKVEGLVKALSLKASSTKTKNGSIKVTLKVDADEIKDIEDLGYTVKYKFYRSTKKASSYKAKLEKDSKTYTNTTGKKGTRYYYKARVMVYDSEGTLIAKSALTQCKYATRIK